MTRILMVRHGQSTANISGFFAGWIDSPLTELGRIQARETARYISDTYPISAVYTSDLRRAAAVGEAVGEMTGLIPKPDPALREIHGGAWEGHTFPELKEKFPSYRVWLGDIGSARCPAGESVAQLSGRIVSAVTAIAMAHPKETVVIATHATPIRVMQCHCLGQGLSQMKHIPWVSNASVSEFLWDGSCFFQGRIGYDGHLGSHSSHLPKNV